MLQFEIRHGNPVAAIIVDSMTGETLAAMCCNAETKWDVAARLVAYATEKGIYVQRSSRT